MMDRIYTLQACLRDGRELIYVGRSSGLYRHDPIDRTEQNLYASLESAAHMPTTALFLHESLIIAGVPGGLLRLSDDGEIWQITRFPMPTTTITAMLIAPNGGLLAATLEDGVFAARTANGTPEPRNYGLLDSRVMALAVNRSGLVFAGTANGLFVSETQGLSWRETDFLLPTLSLATTHNNDLLIGTEADGLWLWRSALGVSPERVYDCNAPINACVSNFDGQRCFAAVENCLLVSSDGGHTWQDAAAFDGSITTLTASYALRGQGIWIAVGADMLFFDGHR
jgi:ligand-binding sensor domain-containing protein